MATRAYHPPATCSRCDDRPSLGESLFHTGSVWLCAKCLTDETPGQGIMTKLATRAGQADQTKAFSRRARASGDIEHAVALGEEARWHQQAAIAIHQHGTRVAQQATIIHGEAVPANEGYLKDTLADPDLAAVESSEMRGRLLQLNDSVALGVDVANTVRASNTAEKLIAHEIAVAHKVAMEQVRRAQTERDPAMEIKRLQLSAKMMGVVRDSVLALQRLKASGPQSVTVQHVHVNAGGQALVGNVTSGN